MDEILAAFEALSLEMQAADHWGWQLKLEKIKQMLIAAKPIIFTEDNKSPF